MSNEESERITTSQDVSRLHDKIDEPQADALRLAAELVEPIDGFQEPTMLEAAAAAELRRLHARVQELEIGLKKANAQAEHFEREWYLRGDELEASQAQRVPLTASQVAELLDEAGYSIWDMTRADFINGIRHGECAHGITQEKRHGK